MKYLNLNFVTMVVFLTGCNEHLSKVDPNGSNGGESVSLVGKPLNSATLRNLILIPNCTTKCHNGSNAKSPKLLTYDQIMEYVSPGEPEFSKFFVVLLPGEDQMPPPPRTPLNSEQIDFIKRWILEGAPE